MKVTRLSEQAKDKNRISIYVDDEYSFSLSVEQLASEGLRPGQDISKADIERLKNKSEYGKAKFRVLDKLSRRRHSEKEIYDWLLNRDYGPPLIKEVIKDLVSSGLLNDEEFAEGWIRSRKNYKNYSNYVISQELRIKGISEDIISLHLEGAEQEVDSLVRLIQKKQKTARYQEDQKLMAFLMRKGFKYQDIKKALHQLQDEN